MSLPKWRPALLLLLVSGAAHANNLVVSHTNIIVITAAHGIGTAQLFINGQPIPVGDTLVAVCVDTTSGSTTFTTPTDTLGNTWVPLPGVKHWNTIASPTESVEAFWVASNITQGTFTTITCPGATAMQAWQFHSPTGVIGLNATTAWAETDNPGTTPVSAAITTSIGNTMIFSFWVDSVNSTNSVTGTGFGYLDITSGSDGPLMAEVLGFPSTGLTSSPYAPDAALGPSTNYVVGIWAFAEGTSTPTITTSCPLPSGTTGTAYSQTMASIDPLATWDLSSGSVPTGLTLFPNTGVINGSPTVPGTYNFTLRATNVNGAATKSCSLVIASSGSAAGVIAGPNSFRGPSTIH